MALASCGHVVVRHGLDVITYNAAISAGEGQAALRGVGPFAEMQQNGVEIGGHTVTHPSLGRVSESQAKVEIVGCSNALNENLGRRSRTFCYPNGQPSDFQYFLPALVEDSGFLGAVTAFPDANGTKDPFLMRRHVSGDDMFQFFKATSGVEFLGHRLRREIRLRRDSHLGATVIASPGGNA